jgi:hypothetical protein
MRFLFFFSWLCFVYTIYACSLSILFSHRTMMLYKYVSSVNPARTSDPLESNAVRSANTASIVPLASTAPMGSCVPPSAAVASREAPLSSLPFQNVRHEDFLGCLNCGKNHHISICQERDPWEYRAQYYGSPDFAQGFYMIPAVEAEVKSLELLN